DEQRLLDAVPGLVVDRPTAGERGERPRQGGARLAEPIAQAGRRWRDRGLGRRGHRGRRRAVPINLGQGRGLLEPLGPAREAGAAGRRRSKRSAAASTKIRRRSGAARVGDMGGLWGSGAGGASGPPSASPDGRSSASGGGGPPRR